MSLRVTLLFRLPETVWFRRTAHTPFLCSSPAAPTMLNNCIAGDTLLLYLPPLPDHRFSCHCYWHPKQSDEQYLFFVRCFLSGKPAITIRQRISAEDHLARFRLVKHCLWRRCPQSAEMHPWRKWLLQGGSAYVELYIMQRNKLGS